MIRSFLKFCQTGSVNGDGDWKDGARRRGAKDGPWTSYRCQRRANKHRWSKEQVSETRAFPRSASEVDNLFLALGTIYLRTLSNLLSVYNRRAAPVAKSADEMSSIKERLKTNFLFGHLDDDSLQVKRWPDVFSLCLQYIVPSFDMHIMWSTCIDENSSLNLSLFCIVGNCRRCFEKKFSIGWGDHQTRRSWRLLLHFRLGRMPVLCQR